MDVIETKKPTNANGAIVEEPDELMARATSTTTAGTQASSTTTATVEEEEPRPFRSTTSNSSNSTSTTTMTSDESSSLMVVHQVEEAEHPQAAARVPEDEEEELQQHHHHKQGDGEEEEEDDDDDDEYEYEYEDDDAFVSGFIDNPNIAAMKEEKCPVKIEEESAAWREPSRQAVNMSLRAETETTGSKRRLAQDLYRIMNQDTEAAGFDLEPVEDDMGKWRIRVFQIDSDSNLAKDMLVLNIPHIELEMTFPDQYPFEPPFVRVVRPRFKKQTGFVMNGALCMELLTKDGWNPINDIESVIVSIRSLLVVGDGRLEAAVNLTEKKYKALLAAAQQAPDDSSNKRLRTDSAGDSTTTGTSSKKKSNTDNNNNNKSSNNNATAVASEGGSYSVSEAKAAYSHLSDYHKKKGWDTSGWWAKKG